MAGNSSELIKDAKKLGAGKCPVGRTVGSQPVGPRIPSPDRFAPYPK